MPMDKSNVGHADPVKIPAGQSQEWHFHPNLLISMSSVFDVPPKSAWTIGWLLGTWTKLTPPVSHLLFALICTVFLLPSMETMQQFSWRWVLQVFAINFGAVVLLAGLLHWYLHIYTGQAMQLKFDIRSMEKHSRFTFGNQVWGNMFWSLVSGAPIWAVWLVIYFYAASKSWVPILESVSKSTV